MDYKEKYLKYKTKYLTLKAQIGNGDKKSVFNKCSTLTNRFICDDKPDCKWNSTGTGNCTIDEKKRIAITKNIISMSAFSNTNIRPEECEAKIKGGIIGPDKMKGLLNHIIQDNNNELQNNFLNCVINETDGQETGCKIQKDKENKKKYNCVKNSWDA